MPLGLTAVPSVGDSMDALSCSMLSSTSVPVVVVSFSWADESSSSSSSASSRAAR